MFAERGPMSFERQRRVQCIIHRLNLWSGSGAAVHDLSTKFWSPPVP